MPLDPSRRSSRTSVISVEPSVASHIIKGTKTTSTGAGTKSSKGTGAAGSGHARTESTPARSTVAALVITSNGHSRTNSAPNNRNLKKRSNSLKRAKNSTEVLKLRAAAIERNGTQADASGVKQGRNFTVSNVGTGGLLHLSPSPHQAPFTASMVSHSPYSWMPQPVASSLLSETIPGAATAQQQHTRTRSVSPKRLLGRVALNRTSREFGQRTRIRSQSFSTLDESRKSIHTALQPKTLKIVINRPESPTTSDDDDDEEAVPSLQIPIPHYKLGTPRFSAHGTPFIRSSNYAQGSGPNSTKHSSMADGVGGPPLSSLKAFSRIQQSLPLEESGIPLPDPLRVMKLGHGRSTSITSYMTPITAELYDAILEVYDDPTVVRYANADKDIAAATKIRIIAQISSESFMDYDLVSDFFLTFRSYMTTFEVLDYLLARLKWSVRRLSDDGRIIRIRTFAALRHWILNYFAEDFVVNRHLRLRFCQEVNDLYETVRNRPRGVAGVSDLKILQDLKRCWNGRCALYWDAEAFNMDADQEEPLLPGGVLGSRNPAYADISEATAALGLGLRGFADTPLSSVSTKSTRRTNHKRLPSSEHAKKPLSVASEQSIQPKSCSLPRSKSKHGKAEGESQGRAPQPVSVLARRQNAPTDLKVHVHKQLSNDTEDAVLASQDTPVEALVKSGHYVDPHAGSMIRGFVYGPVEPFIHLPMNPPLSPSVRFSADRSSNSSPRTTSDLYHAQGPAVKNIFGSIRRALSGKHGSNEVALITVSNARPSYGQTGRRTPVPLSLARSNDDLRRKAAGVPPKTQLRIDLLCAAAVQSFRTILPDTQETVLTPRESAWKQSDSRGLLSPPLSAPQDTPRPDPPNRFPSHYTARSGSILIVDDTAVAMPVMSGALPDSYIHSRNLSLQDPPLIRGEKENKTAFQMQEAGPDPALQLRHTSMGEDNYHDIGLARSTGSALLVGGKSDWSRTDSAVTVKKLAFSPVFHDEDEESDLPTESLRSISPPAMTEATSKSESPISKAPLHGLRRRPGGDLRKNQNVHDMETQLQHQSLDSMLDSSSYGGSVLLMGRSPTTSPPARRRPSEKVSMIKTDSSHHLRPSFQSKVGPFSDIPDGDDGGLEATLLKLEGRYENKFSLSHPSTSPTVASFAASSEKPHSISTNPTDQDVINAYEGPASKNSRGAPASFLRGDSAESQVPQLKSHRFAHKSTVFGLPTESPAGSESGSDVSLPILKRHTGNMQSAIEDELDKEDPGARSSSEILEVRRATSQESARPDTLHTDGGRSFFLNEDEDFSDLSSEISVDFMTYTNDKGSIVSPMFAAPGTAISGLEIPSHPLTHASLVNLSMHTSPPLAGAASFVNQPLTPQQSPLAGQGEEIPRGTTNLSKKQLAIAETVKSSIPAGPSHVPFILACESDVLAQQFTLVEQSALTEIEWTDLVEMRWSSDRSTTALDWAEYMAKHDDARGIDVVATRFNLVIKWVLSEIVLTQDIEERARVLSKLIHVAAHARRLRNYATMLQITIALTSTSCSRLKKTWELVPGHDKSVLKHMEKLAQPMRNFHDLRLEMESTDLTDGCIPFLGLYVHDLTYNAQKPAEIQVAEGQEPLINFERFRTGAVIIKGLLRLIDASLRYDFEPLHGIIERCLWLSALADDRIDSLSKALEGYS